MPRPGATFRVFVSSTFDDLTAERDAPQAVVFPRLWRMCLEAGHLPVGTTIMCLAAPPASR